MRHPSLRLLLQPAFEALRIYWPAMLIIQIAALAVVISYYKVDGADGIFGAIAEMKVRGGLLFSAAATIISGGVLPEMLKRVFRPAGVIPPGRSELANQFAMWAGVGMLVDLFYRLQTVLFGSATDAATLLPKVLLDQFVFTPLVSQPFIIGVLCLYESRYRFSEWRRRMAPPILFQRVLPLWITCLGFWPIMLLIIYSLPANLQFPLFLFGNSAFSILMIFIARRQGALAETQAC